MKIFYFAGTKLPSQHAQSVHAMKMAQAFAKSGHDVTLFAKSTHTRASEDIFKAYNTDPCFTLHMSSQSGTPALSSLKRLVGFSRQISKMGEPDLIFGHDPVALTLLNTGNVPILFEAHKVPTLSAHHWAFKQLLRHKNLRGIIAISDALKKEYLKKYPEIEPEQIFVAYDGADLIENITAKEKDQKALRGRLNAFNVGYAGSMLPGKGVELISRIAALRPEYDFHILGGTAKQVQKLETHNKHPNIYFYGFKEHAQVPSYLKAFDICIAPYQHRALIRTGRNVSRWMSPMKIFEYMAVEKPIIASRMPIIEEILEHNHNAVLLPAAKEEIRAETIDELKENEEKRKRLAHNAYDCLKDRYTWDKRAQAITSFTFDPRAAIKTAQYSQTL